MEVITSCAVSLQRFFSTSLSIIITSLEVVCTQGNIKVYRKIHLIFYDETYYEEKTLFGKLLWHYYIFEIYLMCSLTLFLDNLKTRLFLFVVIYCLSI